MEIGIDSLSFYVPKYFLNLEQLEKARGNFAKKHEGVVQKKMSICPPDEDVVTMGYNAAKRIVEEAEKEKIKLLLFCTETSFDQSKAGGLYIHHFLNLPNDCKVMELKQACYSSTGALDLAKALVSMNKGSKVLVIASDIAKYQIGSSGEKTQGAGAVAMIISENPRILKLESHSGVYSNHTMDFWRPYYLEHALVSPSYSVKNYIKVLKICWNRFKEKSELGFRHVNHFCYHTPFPPMIQKVHRTFCNVLNGQKFLMTEVIERILNQLDYNCQIGNCYTASLYISLISLLDNSKNLAGKRIGFFSYGSGCVAEYFSGIVQDDYQNFLFANYNTKLLENRKEISVDQYEKFYNFQYPKNGSCLEISKHSDFNGNLRLIKIENYKRKYDII